MRKRAKESSARRSTSRTKKKKTKGCVDFWGGFDKRTGAN